MLQLKVVLKLKSMTEFLISAINFKKKHFKFWHKKITRQIIRLIMQAVFPNFQLTTKY